jgi:hypothetical protein
MYFAIRVAVASAIMIAFYVTRGFGSKLETFVMAFAAALAAQAVAFGVKLLAGDQPKSRRAFALLAGCVLAVGAAIAFIALDARAPAEEHLHGYLEQGTLRRAGDTFDFTVRTDDNRRVSVRYTGVPPDKLEERAEIVAVGHYRDGVYVATTLVAKCPSTYNTPKGPVPAAQYR